MPNPETGSQTKKPAKTQSAGRSRPTRILPTSRIAFDNQLNILRGYAAASGTSLKAVTNDEVAKIVGSIMSSTISLSNAFFADNGLLIRNDQAFVPSQDVIAFARAWDWSPASAAQKLAPVLRRTWFAELLVPLLQFQARPEEEVISELGGHVNAGTEYRPQLKTLIDYLEAANVVRRDNGSIRLVSGGAPATPAPETTKRDASAEPGEGRDTKTPVVATSFAQATQGIINFHVDVRVDMAEFSDWSADRITAFFAGVAQVLAAKSALEKEASGE
jgi:hypothetical protein